MCVVAGIMLQVYGWCILFICSEPFLLLFFVCFVLCSLERLDMAVTLNMTGAAKGRKTTLEVTGCTSSWFKWVLNLLSLASSLGLI